ncbi:MAG: hypothetical protein AAFZ04_01355 [Pseudomonadota bacterium]
MIQHTRPHIRSAAHLCGVVACYLAWPADAATLSPSIGQDGASLTALAAAAPKTRQAFFWSPQTGFTPSATATAHGLSGDGAAKPVLLGFASNPDERGGFRWDPNLGLVPMNDPAPTMGAPWVRDANASRAVIWRPEDRKTLQTLLSPDGNVRITQVIDVAPGGLVLAQAQIPGDGTMGYFVWQASQDPRPLKTSQGDRLLSERAISPSGQVIGQIEAKDGQRYGALFSAHGAPLVLRGLDGDPSKAVGLNARGDVVGASEGAQPEAVVWPASGAGPVALGTVIDPALPSGFRLIRADDINDAGMIIANALGPDGSVHMVRLTPDPTRPGGYIPVILGHILSDAEDLDDVTLALSEAGLVIGSCDTGAQDCPRLFDATALDPAITNLAPTGLQPPGFLPLISDRILSGDRATGGAPPAGADTALLATPTASPSPVTTPFGPTTFPGLTGGGTGGGETPSTPATAPVPLPAPLWLLAFALCCLVGAAVRQRRSLG